MLRRITSLAVALAAMAISHQGFAEEEAEKKWKASAELGYVSTSGNSEDTTVKARLDGEREFDKWRYTGHFDALNAESEGDRSAEKYFISNNFAYKFNEHDYAFIYHSYDDDRFTGYEFQTTLSAGYGRRILLPPPMTWDVEIGPGFRYSEFDDSPNNVANDQDGDSLEEFVVRLYTKYTWELSETSTFEQELNVEAGEESNISKSTTSLKVNVVGNVAMKLSYTIKYNDEVPQGTKQADTETAVTLLYEF